MLFADAGDVFLTMVFLVAIASLLFRAYFHKFDDKGEINGAVHDAAKKGVVNLIGKWLK
jgi:hypothetical protein